MAFIVSIGEPPPIAIKKSQFDSLYFLTPASTITSVGSPVISVYSANSTPCFVKAAFTLSTLASFTIIGSATIKAFLPNFKSALSSAPLPVIMCAGT